MAAATQQAQAHSAHTPSATTNSDQSANDSLSWDQEKMFNIYIWDYCVKRGFRKTARELADEAQLQNPRPPIDAKQGLLYEWWYVFWNLFNAKSNNSGSEDAMVYIQHQLAQSRMHQVPGAMPRYPNGLQRLGPGAMPATVPNSLVAAGAPPHPGHPNQAPNAHPMPNGIGPTAPGQQQPGQPHGQGPFPPQQTPGQQHQQQVPQAPPPLGFPAHVPQQQPQPNGVLPHARPGMPVQPQPGPGAGQRPPQMSYYQQSPTMAHQQTGGPPGPPPPYPGGPIGASGMPPNMYPQPHMRGMLHQGIPNGVTGGAVSGVAAGSPGFAQGNVGTGSRAPTPGQLTAGGSNLTQPSPSMIHRSVPATPPNFGGPSGMAVPGGRGPPFDQLNAEISKIDAATLNDLRQEMGLGNKDPATMSIDEKNRLVNIFKQRNTPGKLRQKRKGTTHTDTITSVCLGPSNPTRSQHGRGAKRNSVSPGDEHAEIPTVKGESSSSPPQKRARRSPEQPAPPGTGSAGSASQGAPSNGNPGQNTPQGGMYSQNMMPGMMSRQGGPPFTQQMGPVGMGQPRIQGVMMPPGAHPGMINQQMQFQSPVMQAMHNKMSAPDQQQMQQPQFGGGPAPPSFGGAGQRGSVNQGKMLPPNSPATTTNANGQGKPPQNAQVKTEGTGKVETSPRNGPPPPPSGSTGRSPPTPASGQGGQSAPSPSLSRPATATSNPPTGGPPAPISATAVPAPPASAPPAPADPPNFDFMATGFDDFTSMFGRDEATEFNIDPDFNWFSSDITGMTDLGR